MTTEQAYAEVERLTRRRARNFAYGIMVLPREKRRAIAAIYAFARRVEHCCISSRPETNVGSALAGALTDPATADIRIMPAP